MKVTLKNVAVSHIVAGLPKKTVQISEYEKIFGAKAVRRVQNFVGVESIHVAEDNLCASDYDVMLAEYLMKETGLQGSDFDGIVFISQTPDYIMPATGVTLQDRLGLPKTAVSFDINCGCTGYIYGIYQAALLVSSGSCKRVLVFTGDTKVRMLHPQDKTTRMVFGDAFSASVVERGELEISFNINSDGSGYDCIIVRAGGYRLPKSDKTSQPILDRKGRPHWLEYMDMQGLKVMDFIMTQIPPMIEETLEYVGWSKDEVDVFAMHQVNQTQLFDLADRLDVPREKVPVILKNSGNIGSASLPSLLSMLHGELSGRLGKVLMCAFGVGLSYGTMAVDFSETKIFDALEL